MVRREDLKKYIMEREIGCGGQARVYKVFQKTTMRKLMMKRNDQIQVDSQLDSPTGVANLIREVGAGQNPEQVRTSKLDDPIKGQAYAVKIIRKDDLARKSEYQRGQVINEI